LDTDRLGITRWEFQQALHEMNIGTGVHFVALHLHSYYAKTLGYQRGDFPNAEYVSDRTLSLPLSAKLTEQDTEDVVAAIRAIIARHVG
jgi:dTDP-4-amino-4,6-dideoxygalactose transaminase